MPRLFPAAVVLFWWGQVYSQEKIVFRAPHIQVLERKVIVNGSEQHYHMLLHHRIAFGANFLKPRDRHSWGDSQKDLSRLATTSFPPKSPLGLVLRKFNWFPGPANTYWADTRLPASLVALGGASVCPLPLGIMAGLWTEPPIGVIGMETGTVASYARPFQHLDIFENDRDIIALSRGKNPFFHYLNDASRRGARIRIYTGQPRSALEKKAPAQFYRILIVEPYKVGVEILYKDLLTKEGMALCLSKLAPGGILCVLISNRYYSLAPIVADAAKSLGCFCIRAYDQAPWENSQAELHFSSEWVFVARHREDLAFLDTPCGYADALKAAKERGWYWPNEEQFWRVPKAAGKHLWTDRGEKSYRGLYRGDPRVDKLRYLIYDTQDSAVSLHIPARALQRLTHAALPLLKDLERLSVEMLNKRGP